MTALPQSARDAVEAIFLEHLTERDPSVRWVIRSAQPEAAKRAGAGAGPGEPVERPGGREPRPAREGGWG